MPNKPPLEMFKDQLLNLSPMLVAKFIHDKIPEF